MEAKLCRWGFSDKMVIGMKPKNAEGDPVMLTEAELMTHTHTHTHTRLVLKATCAATISNAGMDEQITSIVVKQDDAFLRQKY